MFIDSKASAVRGTVRIPTSKSHSIRAVFLAALAEGTSTIRHRLRSADVDSAIAACKTLGAGIEESGEVLRITGFNGKPTAPKNTIDVGNSGTTANFALALAALCDKPVTVTADDQTRKRPIAPLLESLKQLGAVIESSNNGLLPVTIRGPIKGGIADVAGSTSQYLSALLIHGIFCETAAVFKLKSLNEKPYADMTVAWLKKLGVRLEQDNHSEYRLAPRQSLKAFEADIPSDWSSAAFFLVLAAIPGCEVTLEGLDFTDTQGDKEVVNYLKAMGADIEVGDRVKIRGKKLRGTTLDLNNTPDALPAMAVAGALAEGVTHLTNVPQARIKETDRIAVMCQELAKMGADITEERDGLIIKGGTPLRGTAVAGHYDHRVVMSLAVAGLAAAGTTTIDSAEAINITFPDFVDKMRACGADMRLYR
ncbi:MAG: 3-phosphoshikimate 1-carboxyvinyltransferase [Nitrospinae bacterium]|nr:3-phosphoshikimate 1-carboxyvinyltransferase [Nitrospinota bacterium]